MGGGSICEVDASECIDPVGRIFGLPPEPLEEWIYLLFQVQCGSPCRLQMPGARGGQERGAEQRLYEHEGGYGGAGRGNLVVNWLLLGDPWCTRCFP